MPPECAAWEDPGPRIRPVWARARDGVIEALDCPGDRMDLTAVEWHPEMMSREDALAQALFTRFVRHTTAN